LSVISNESYGRYDMDGIFLGLGDVIKVRGEGTGFFSDII